jgi:hypothetical protein
MQRVSELLRCSNKSSCNNDQAPGPSDLLALAQLAATGEVLGAASHWWTEWHGQTWFMSGFRATEI